MAVYEQLHACYGPQSWWPAESPFEVMVGAILTQNTRWEGVEIAIHQLKTADLLTPEAIAACESHRLELLIRPAGFFRQKSRRLVELSRFLLANGGVEALKRRHMPLLRDELLALHGVGPETADSMLLYALDKAIFVVDAYTKRIFSRLGLIKTELSYSEVQHHFNRKLANTAADMLLLFQEYHALIVTHAKRHCKTRPICHACPLNAICESALDRLGGLLRG